MSKSTEVAYTCPRCQKLSAFVVWQSVNVELDPELKKRVLDGSLFEFVCPHCHAQQSVAYSLFYHDPEARFMIWWQPEQQAGDKELALSSITLPGYRLRLVPTLNRLREKIYILDQNLDDRALELLKRFLWSSRFEDEGVHRDELYFSAAYLDQEHPCLEISIVRAGSRLRTFRIDGLGGYPRALEMLHTKFKVPLREKTEWRTVDHTYWDIAQAGQG